MMTDSPGLAIKIQQKLKLQIKVLLSLLWCVFYRFSLHFSSSSVKKEAGWIPPGDVYVAPFLAVAD